MDSLDNPAGNGRVAAPFLRWIGGKQRLAQRLRCRLPQDYQSLQYHEPFMGAGSLFFLSAPGRARLSDLNPHLMSCHEYVRDQSAEVAGHLVSHADGHSKDYYYRQRTIYNAGEPSAEQAARFIYLNKACFNGIFRVNRRGEFNVPWGNKLSPALPNSAALQSAAKALATAELTVLDYQEALERVSAGQFAYIDPPYPAPVNGNSFALYTTDRFGPEDHRRLAHAVKSLSGRGGLFMMSNADTPEVRALYAEFDVDVLPAIRYVTCKKKKYAVNELVITNY